MKIAIMQPYVFPYIGYFQLIHSVDKFIVYDDVNYIKSGWINRNNILTNKKANLFSIPLDKASSFSMIHDTFINANLFPNWKLKFLKSLEQSYKKAPYYQEAMLVINQVFDFDLTQSVSKLAFHCISSINDYVGLKTKVQSTSSIYNNLSLNGQDRIIDICKQEHATSYHNPIGGQELYSKDFFQENKIDLKFVKTKNILYKQYDNEFVPWLSIIDVLMFNSKVEIVNLLNQYELI